MEGTEFCCYEFGEFKLDARRRSLFKNGEKVPLSARNFDLLVFMVENGGRILEHDELLEKVWAGTFVEQATLKKGISALRQILSENPENEFIKTIPRRGYSFVSPVRVVPEDGGLVLVRETEQQIIVEEYEEIEEDDNNLLEGEKIIQIPSASVKALPAAEEKKNTKSSNLSRVAILAGAGLIVLLLVFFGLRPYLARMASPQFSAENVRITRITNSGNVIAGTSASADGNYLLYPIREKDGVSLWLRQILSNGTKKLTQTKRGNFWGFVIAPDNSYVYYIFNDIDEPLKTGLYKMPLLGGEAQRIAENVGTVAVSPDGKRLAIGRSGGSTTIFTIDTNGGNEQAVKSYPSNYRLWSLRWTPDSASLLCAVRKIVDDKYIFYVAEISPETGQENIILPDQERVINGAEWMPDKSALLLVVRETNADIRQVWQYFPSSKEWRRVTNDNNSYKSLTVTSDGKSIITSQESRLAAIWISDVALPAAGSADKKLPVIGRDNFRHITDGISSFDRVGWLADGRLFYSAAEDGKETVYTINADGTNAYQITNGEDGIWIFPGIAGNGQNVSFLSSRTGSKQVWRVDGDGKNLTKLTNVDTQLLAARILRDNSTIIYEAQSKSGDAILYRQTPDGQTNQLTQTDTGFFAVSPDEKLLAAEIQDKNTNKMHLEVRSLEDGKTIKTFEISPNRQISFTPGGKYLAYDIKNADTGQIMLQSLAGGDPQALTDFQSDDIFSFDWTFDGGHLAVIRGKQLDDAVIIKSNTH